MTTLENQAAPIYFLHIHKTAGTTLRQILESRFGYGEICPAQVWPELIRTPKTELAQYKLFRGHFFCFLQWLPVPPVIITMLRDPVERTLSTYHFIRRNKDHHLHSIASRMSLSEYLENPRTRMTIENYQTRWIVANLVPARASVTMKERLQKVGDPLAFAIQEMEKFAFVGLVERFSESVQMLLRTFGWEGYDPSAEKRIEAMNVTHNRPKQDDLPPGVLARIGKLTELDRGLYSSAERMFERKTHELASASHPSELDRACDRWSLSFHEPILGAGWYSPEKIPGADEGYRWSGPTNRSTINLPVKTAQSYHYKLHVNQAAARDILANMRISVNSFELNPTVEKHDHGWTYSGVISEETVNRSFPWISFGLEVPRTTQIKKLFRIVDSRGLGVAVRSLELTPAQSTIQTSEKAA